VLDVEILEEVFERPAGLDGPEEILETLVNTLGSWEIEVLLETSLEYAREQVPRIVASLEQVEDGVLMRCSVESLDGMARFLAGLFCPFVVRRPPELREALKEHASEITRLAGLRAAETP
jgi:predicted DNA-binding transcriptional regulator YafY